MKTPRHRDSGVSKISPPLRGGDYGEGETTESPPPSPSPLKGEGTIGKPHSRDCGVLKS